MPPLSSCPSPTPHSSPPSPFPVLPPVALSGGPGQAAAEGGPGAGRQQELQPWLRLRLPHQLLQEGAWVNTQHCELGATGPWGSCGAVQMGLCGCGAMSGSKVGCRCGACVRGPAISPCLNSHAYDFEPLFTNAGAPHTSTCTVRKRSTTHHRGMLNRRLHTYHASTLHPHPPCASPPSPPPAGAGDRPQHQGGGHHVQAGGCAAGGGGAVRQDGGGARHAAGGVPHGGAGAQGEGGSTVPAHGQAHAQHAQHGRNLSYLRTRSLSWSHAKVTSLPPAVSAGPISLFPHGPQVALLVLPSP